MSKEPRDVVMAAFSYLQAVIPPTQKISDPRIEEVTKDDKKAQWKIIISYDAIGEFPFDRKREYKEFSVDDTTGEVLSMKISKSK